MATYGYKTYKARHFVAHLRFADGCSMADILTFGQDRKAAFVHFASKHRAAKIERVVEIDPTDTDSLEQFGFIFSPCRPALAGISASERE